MGQPNFRSLFAIIERAASTVSTWAWRQQWTGRASERSSQNFVRDLVRADFLSIERRLAAHEPAQARLWVAPVPAHPFPLHAPRSGALGIDDLYPDDEF